MSEYLVHYGVKGMKWGKRKQDFKDLDAKTQDRIASVIDAVDNITYDRVRSGQGRIVNYMLKDPKEGSNPISRNSFGGSSGRKERIKDRLRNGESIRSLRETDPELLQMGFDAARKYVDDKYNRK